MKDLLIVENDTIVTKIWATYFSQYYNVKRAHSVGEALIMVKEKLPDAVILDLRLNGPEDSGLSVYSYIRNVCQSSIPVIFVTGLDSDTLLYKEADTIAAVDYEKGMFTKLFVKPIKLSTLEPVIETMMSEAV